jgi:hypothetical protein
MYARRTAGHALVASSRKVCAAPRLSEMAFQRQTPSSRQVNVRGCVRYSGTLRPGPRWSGERVCFVNPVFDIELRFHHPEGLQQQQPLADTHQLTSYVKWPAGARTVRSCKHTIDAMAHHGDLEVELFYLRRMLHALADTRSPSCLPPHSKPSLLPHNH